MEGPARGLRNAVWSISPDTVSAAPARTAVIACGKRLPTTINRNGPSGSPLLKSISITCAGGISTEPTNRFSKNSTTSDTQRITNFIPLQLFSDYAHLNIIYESINSIFIWHCFRDFTGFKQFSTKIYEVSESVI